MANFKNPWGTGTPEGDKWIAKNALSLTNQTIGFDENIEESESSNYNNNNSGIIGVDGRVIKFSVNSKGKVKIKSNNADFFTERYIDSMALTKTSREVLLTIRDGEIRIEIKNMTQKENDILRKTGAGEFKSISGTVMSKEKYNNFQNCISEKINKEEYLYNENVLNNSGVTIIDEPNNAIIDNPLYKLEKLEQYNQQVILINDDVIKGFKDSNREFFKTSLEESIHSIQRYTYRYAKGIQSHEDYLNMPHEKQAKDIVEIAEKEYDLIKNK